MTVANQKDAETQAQLLTAARELLTEDANFSLKTLLTRTGVSRARFRRCFADKEQLLLAITGAEAKSLGDILQAAQPQVQSLRAAVGSDLSPMPAAAVAAAAPAADAWLERRLRVFERALAGLEKRQEKSEQDLAHQLAVMGETLTTFVRSQSAVQQPIKISPPVRIESAKIEPIKAEALTLAQGDVEFRKFESGILAPVEEDGGKTEIVLFAPAESDPELFDELGADEEKPPEADPLETAFAADVAAVTPVTDKEISDFMAHARRVAQNASLAEIAQPERPWNMRWLAWSGAVLLAVMLCTGVLLASGAFGGPAGANPVLTISGLTHRQVAKDGIAHIIALADSGDAAAQTLLALDYLKGNGVASDNDAARRWSLAAANQGQPVAQYLAGTLYLQADPKDGEAVRWFRASAAQGNVKAMHNLAIAYAEGQGVGKDPAEAVKWFTRASTLGYRDSQFDLAVLYERGMGVAQSARDALKWYLIAASNGDTPSAGRARVLQEQVDPILYKVALQDAASFVAKPAAKTANQTPNL